MTVRQRHEMELAQRQLLWNKVATRTLRSIRTWRRLIAGIHAGTRKVPLTFDEKDEDDQPIELTEFGASHGEVDGEEHKITLSTSEHIKHLTSKNDIVKLDL